VVIYQYAWLDTTKKYYRQLYFCLQITVRWLVSRKSLLQSKISTDSQQSSLPKTPSQLCFRLKWWFDVIHVENEQWFKQIISFLFYKLKSSKWVFLYELGYFMRRNHQWHIHLWTRWWLETSNAHGVLQIRLSNLRCCLRWDHYRQLLLHWRLPKVIQGHQMQFSNQQGMHC